MKREDSRAFMDRQLASGLVVRGWLNPAYYTLGSDPGMSYMAAMGGWGVLDYALELRAATRPTGCSSATRRISSSWALMNTGPAETNYGFWFPGTENDGAAGWQFMSTKAGSAWMGSSFPGGVTEPRGPWHYDGEIDLGFGGALRMAATIVTNDPTFGWFAYGGAMKESGNTLEVIPRDGLRRRFDVVIADARREARARARRIRERGADRARQGGESHRVHRRESDGNGAPHDSQIGCSLERDVFGSSRRNAGDAAAVGGF